MSKNSPKTTILNSIKRHWITNNKLRYPIWISILITAVFLLSHCETSKKRPVLKVGFSQCTMADEWRKQMVKEMEREAALYNEVDIQIVLKDAQNNSLKQKSDIEELIAQKVDILIISPNQSDPLVESIKQVNKLGIPIIVIDRIIETDLPFYTIGGNNYNIGEMAGKQAQILLPHGGNILVLTGLAGSTPAQQRQEGFKAGIKGNESILISKVIQSDWTEELAEKQMIEYLNSNTEFDLVFAHNDFMAKGVINAFKKNKTSLKPIIGVDGLNTPGYGIDMILDSTLTATITYPTGGDKAIETAYKIYKKQNSSKQQELSSILINLSNAASIRLQRNEIELQQSKMDRQIEVLSDKDQKIEIQKRQLNRVVILLALSGLLVFIILYFLWKPFVIKINKFRNKKRIDAFDIPVANNSSTSEKQFIADVQEVIMNNITNPKLSIHFIGKELGMSHSTIYRKIKKVTGIKSVELIQHLRLNHATKLLLTTDLPMEEIAFGSGFNTSSYFSTCFVKRHNVSPSKYRKKNSN